MRKWRAVDSVPTVRMLYLNTVSCVETGRTVTRNLHVPTLTYYRNHSSRGWFVEDATGEAMPVVRS